MKYLMIIKVNQNEVNTKNKDFPRFRAGRNIMDTFREMPPNI